MAIRLLPLLFSKSAFTPNSLEMFTKKIISKIASRRSIAQMRPNFKIQYKQKTSEGRCQLPCLCTVLLLFDIFFVNVSIVDLHAADTTMGMTNHFRLQIPELTSSRAPRTYHDDLKNRSMKAFGVETLQ